jgi:SAM-dependent methyltransferase
VAPTRWAQEVVDAQALPYDAGSLANLVMVDVLHHLPNPSHCLAEAERTLKPGGRLVMLEPYCSPVSTLLYRVFHHERTDLDVDPFADQPQSSDEPFDSNQAIPTLIFWRRLGEFTRRNPGLSVIGRRRLATLAYPLSGGFSKPALMSERLLRATELLERLLAPAARLLAFRCLVVLERRAGDRPA